VCFYPYQNFNPQTSEPANNLSRFKNTGFITTEFLYGMEIEPSVSSIPETFVDLQLVEGILFKGNTFQNLATTSDESRGTGIRSGSAGFYVYNECAVPNTTPCPEYYISRFQHLDYGIMVFDDRESLPIVIDSATFTDNKRGILMSGVNNAEIFHNTFEMDMPDSYHSTSDTLIGVYLEACQEFLLTENYFTGYSGTQMEHAAIYAHNLGPYYNEIYNNSIENLSCGIIAAGENRDEEDNDVGLCIKCNDFTDCQYDVFVTPYGGINPDRFGIAETQGHLGSAAPQGVNPNTMAAGNTFSDPDFSDLEYQFFNNANLDIVTYYHHSNLARIFLEPEEYNNIDPSRDDQVEYSKSVSCPTILNENINLLTEYNYIESESVTVELYQDTLDVIVDGGSTDDLNFEVQTSFPDEALQIRQDLLDDSPYLSDTVMNSAIIKEDVLPNAMIRDILVSNPQSAKSANVLNTLNSRFDPMPDYMMAEIMNGLNVFGHKEVLEKNKGKHINNRQKTFSKLIRFYKKDTINSWSNDSLIGLFNKENTPNSLYRSSLHQLNMDDSLSACNTLASIPTIFTLNTEEQDEYQSFSDLFSIISELRYHGYVLDSIQESTLEDLSQNNNDFIGIYARNILINHGLKKYNEQIFLPDNLKSSTTWELPEESGLKNPSVLKVFPNPGKNYFILEYDIREFVGVPTVKITDITGKPFAFIRLSYKQNQMVQATNDWPAGIYLIQLAIDNSIIESCKLSLIK